MAIISGTPTSYTKPGVTVNLNINDSSTGSNEFLVLVMGNATSGTTMYGKTGPYLFTTLDQLAADFGKTSDIYTIIEQYRVTDSSTSLYAINLIATNESTSTVSNGNILSITSNLNSTASATDPAGTGIAATGGSGTGATFDVTSTPSSTKFLPASVAINNPGTGYKVGDTLTITGVGTLTVTTVDETTVTGVTDDVLMEQTLATIGDIEFDLVLGTLSSAAAIQGWQTYAEKTWSATSELYGIYVTAKQAASANAFVTAAADFTSADKTVVFPCPMSLSPARLIGQAAAEIATRTQISPSLPLRSWALGIGVVPLDERMPQSVLDTLFANGYSTISFDRVGNPTIQRTRIAATQSSTGDAINDTSLETPFQSAYAAKYFRTQLSPYTSSPHILVDDGLETPSIYMVSPSAVKGTMVHAYQDLIDLGVCTDIKSFTTSLAVEKDTQVIGRLNIQASGTLTWGLNQIALNLSLSK